LLTDAIFVRDLDNKILFWNKGAERLYAGGLREALGRMPGFCAQKLFYKSKELLENSGFRQLARWSCINTKSREIIVASRWTLVRDPSGKPKSILVI